MTAMQPPQRPPKTLAGLTLVLALLGPLLPPRQARAEEPITGLRSLAMGNTLRAAATGAEGVLLNPSGITLLRQYSITGFYSFTIQGLGHALHVSIADSVTQQRVAMGIYFNFVRETPTVDYRVAEGGAANRVFVIHGQQVSHNGYDVGLVTAFPLGDRFSLGITTKYGYFQTNSQLPSDQLPKDFMSQNPSIDQNLVYDMGSPNSTLTFDIGLTLRLLSSLTVALSAQNLWPHGFEQPNLLGFGLAYVPTVRLTVAADAVLNFNGHQTCSGTPDPKDYQAQGNVISYVGADPCAQSSNWITVRAGAGLEYSILSMVPVRLGYLYDSAMNGHHISAGLGYFTPTYGLDIGMRERLSGGLETILIAGFRIFRN